MSKMGKREYVVANVRSWGERSANSADWIKFQSERVGHSLIDGRFWQVSLQSATRFDNADDAQAVADAYVADYPRKKVEVVALADAVAESKALLPMPMPTYAVADDDDDGYAIADSACELAEYECESAADIARDFEGELVDECIHPIRSAKKPFSATQRKAKRDIYAKAMRRFRASGHLYEEKLIRDGEYFKYSEFANRDCVADSACDDEFSQAVRDGEVKAYTKFSIACHPSGDEVIDERMTGILNVNDSAAEQDDDIDKVLGWVDDDNLLKARIALLEKNDRANIERIAKLEGEVADLKHRVADLEGD